MFWGDMVWLWSTIDDDNVLQFSLLGITCIIYLYCCYLQTSASPQVFQCIKCQQCFATETDIRQHVTTHLLQEGNRHECRLCDSSFESPAKLQCHLIEHSFIDGGDSELACSVCAATFSSAVDLQAHAVLHGMHARPYRCSQCSQAFFFSAELLNHAYCHSRDSTNGQHDNSDTTSMLFTASSALENDGGEVRTIENNSLLN